MKIILKKNLIFALIATGMFFALNYINCNKVYAAVGGTLKSMQSKYKMRKISLKKLYIIQPDLSQYDYKNSGITAYEYKINKVKYEVVFNAGEVCWLEFAISNNSAVIPLSSLIKKNLYGYPILFKTIKYVPNVYEKLQYGRNVGKVIYIMQYIYENNAILQEAVMPSMSPDGSYGY